MEAGIYRKVKASGRGRGTGIGELYQFLLMSRDHFDGRELVTYIPLRIEPEWVDTVRPCTISLTDFNRMFKFVGERLPKTANEF